MADRILVQGYEEFKDAVAKFSGKKKINVYFRGSKNELGVSWSPDCVAAEPHIEAAISKFTKKGDVLVVVDVGGSRYWKDMMNPFRTDKEVHISVIPTMIRWKGHQRLEGKQLQNAIFLDMFFTYE